MTRFTFLWAPLVLALLVGLYLCDMVLIAHGFRRVLFVPAALFIGAAWYLYGKIVHRN